MLTLAAAAPVDNQSDVSDTNTMATIPEKDGLIIIEDETGNNMDKNKVVLNDGSDFAKREYEANNTEENTSVTDENMVVVDGDSLPTWAIILIVLGGLLVTSCL